TSLPNVSQRIKGKDAFALFTANASYSLGIENKTGILKPGFDADFVVLDADPRENPCCQVLATYCAGRVVYQKCKWR
ncbi:MAG: amidohydrolase family protein, partial [candidate division WOR-3 bacterium]